MTDKVFLWSHNMVSVETIILRNSDDKVWPFLMISQHDICWRIHFWNSFQRSFYIALFDRSTWYLSVEKIQWNYFSKFRLIRYLWPFLTVTQHDISWKNHLSKFRLMRKKIQNCFLLMRCWLFCKINVFSLLLQELTEEGLPFLILFHRLGQDEETVKRYKDIVNNELISEKRKSLKQNHSHEFFDTFFPSLLL